MSLLINIIWFFYTPIDTTGCSAKFFNKAFSDTSIMGAPLIKVRIVDSSANLFTVLTHNVTLYQSYIQLTGMDYNEYKQFVIDNRDSLVLPKFPESWEESGFVLLQSDKYVNKQARKGKKKFIAHFFTNGSFNTKFNNHLESVISKLFDYQILVAFDNGDYRIIYNANCLH